MNSEPIKEISSWSPLGTHGDIIYILVADVDYARLVIHANSLDKKTI